VSLEKTIEDIVRRVVREELAAERPQALPPALLSVKAYAERTGVAPATIRRLIKDELLPGVKVGSAWRIAADAVVGEPIAATKERRESPDAFAMRLLAGGRR